MPLIRVFVSIPVKDKAAFRQISDDIGRLDNVRATPSGQIHITLQFIGDVDSSKVDKIAKCVERATAGVGPFAVTASGAGAFPDRKRPSVAWIGASPQDLMSSIAARLGKELDAAGIDHDRKPFKSHITVGRCRGPADLEPFFSKYGSGTVSEFLCDSILVMQSELGPGGAKHRVLRKIELQGPSGNGPFRGSQRSGASDDAMAGTALKHR